MLDYKSLHVAVMICATRVDGQLLTGYPNSSASRAKNTDPQI